jgi:hypothetical protein
VTQSSSPSATRPTKLLRAAGRRYAAIGRGLGFFLLLLASCAAASFLIVYPLWLFATGRPKLFTAAVLGGGAVVVASLVFFRIRQRLSEEPGYAAAVLLPGLARVALVLAGIGVTYLTVWLFAAGLYVAAVPMAVLVVAAFGLVSLRR